MIGLRWRSREVGALFGSGGRGRTGRVRDASVGSGAAIGVLPAAIASVVLWSALAARPAFAHKDDYLADTFVFVTLDARELELEYFLDGHFDPKGLGHHFGAEYGFTSRLMGDVALRWLQDSGGPTTFHEGFVEARYRFGEENERVVDPAASLEYHVARDPSRGSTRHLLEPRVVLSKDFRGCNLTVNLAYVIDVNAPKQSAPEFAAGFRSPGFGPFQAGFELRREIVTENATDLVPQIWVHLSEDAYLKAGVSKNLAGDHETSARLAFEIEF